MNQLKFEIEPIFKGKSQLVTTRNFSVFVDNFPIWPVAGDDVAALDIQVDDLLSHLVEAWQPLMLRQTYPFYLQPERPSGVWALARERWSGQSEATEQTEVTILEHFQDVHDFSRSFGGVYGLPSLWLVRSADQMQIEGGDRLFIVAFKEAQAALVELGDALAEILKTAGTRWHRLIQAWQQRDSGDEIEMLRLSTNLKVADVRRLTSQNLLRAPKTVDEAANDRDEPRVAARMASALPIGDIEKILVRIGNIPKYHSVELDRFSHRMCLYFDQSLAKKKPHDQGELAAAHFRELLELPEDSKPDVQAIAEGLGISTILSDMDVDSLDAIAVWGPRHGPATIINSKSARHNGGDFGTGQVRATLAHELCHLLLDAKHSVSAVEVLGGLMPTVAEKRARAFAAEFLLPTRVAEQEWIRAARPENRDGIAALLDDLRQTFGVTKSLASWKVQHAAWRHDVFLENLLNSVVPQR